MLPPLRPGTTLRSRYKVIRAIGAGGMGAIYQAEDLRLSGRLCAVKEVQPEPGLNGEARTQAHDQFHREASVLARLDHPNLPKVSDFFDDSGRDYLVMDFVPGHDLKQVMDEARREGRFLEERKVLAWAAQLCDALEYLHNQDPPILHRDIKPANIKLTPGGLIKLVDFGLVKLMAPDDSRTVTILQGRGTAQYTPLEQYGGDTGHTDIRSDIYSLGATFYHLLTNEPPVEAKQRFLRPESMRAPRAVNPDVSPRTERAVLWALEMHPDNRPPNVAALRRALLGMTGNEIWLPPQAERSPWAEALAANQTLLYLVLGLLAVAILATAFGRS